MSLVYNPHLTLKFMNLKISIVAIPVFLILITGIYFGYYGETENSSVQKEPEYMSIKAEGKTILFEVEDIQGVKLTKWANGNLFDVYGNVEDIRIEFGKPALKKGVFLLKPELTDIYSQIGVYDMQNKPIIIIPVFTASAYSENGFYDFYEKKCDNCTTTKILTEKELVSTSSANAVKILKLLGYDSITDIELDKNPNLISEYNKIIVLHNEYVTKKMFNAITSHPNVIYLYPNALYAEIDVDYQKNEITLIKGHNYPEPEILNGFNWEFENTPYEYDKKCENWEFYDIPNGKMLNCYPEQKIWKDKEFLQMLKEL
jgi:hypothetical protein